MARRTLRIHRRAGRSHDGAGIGARYARVQPRVSVREQRARRGEPLRARSSGRLTRTCPRPPLPARHRRPVVGPHAADDLRDGACGARRSQRRRSWWLRSASGFRVLQFHERGRAPGGRDAPARCCRDARRRIARDAQAPRWVRMGAPSADDRDGAVRRTAGAVSRAVRRHRPDRHRAVVEGARRRVGARRAPAAVASWVPYSDIRKAGTDFRTLGSICSPTRYARCSRRIPREDRFHRMPRTTRSNSSRSCSPDSGDGWGCRASCCLRGHSGCFSWSVWYRLLVSR